MLNSNHVFLYPDVLKSVVIKKGTKDKVPAIYGLLIATTVMSLWAISLAYLLSTNVLSFPVWLAPIAVLWQMFFTTGLFITAHDAMHGSVLPQNSRINLFVGTMAVFAYGLFSYKELLQKHWLHHRHPASKLDPDFHDGTHKNAIAWYFRFMKGYWSWQQPIGFLLLGCFGKFALQIHEINLILFWILPLILSSIQLFYFGTFIPHQQPAGGYTNSHCAQTNSLPTFWSFITCYHFGYHEEHHELPQVPWWQLPIIHKLQVHSKP